MNSVYLTELNGSILGGPTEGLTWRLTTEVDIVSVFIHVASDLEASPCYHGCEGDEAGVAHWPLHHVAHWPLHHVAHWPLHHVAHWPLHHVGHWPLHHVGHFGCSGAPLYTTLHIHKSTTNQHIAFHRIDAHALQLLSWDILMHCGTST